MRQRRWVELSRKPTGSISHLKVVYLPRFMELRSLDARLELTDIGALLATFHVSPCKTPTLLNVFFLILSGWRGCKGNFKKVSVPMTLNWYLEDNGRFK